MASWLMQKIENIKYRFKRLKYKIKWLWRIKDIENWDSSYLLQLMAWQIEDMQQVFKECRNHSSHKQEIHDTTYALHLLKRLIAEDYCLMHHPLCTCHKMQEEEPKPYYDSLGKYLGSSWNFPICAYCKKYGLKQKVLLERHDREQLFSLLAKQLPKWWC